MRYNQLSVAVQHSPELRSESPHSSLQHSQLSRETGWQEGDVHPPTSIIISSSGQPLSHLFSFPSSSVSFSFGGFVLPFSWLAHPSSPCDSADGAHRSVSRGHAEGLGTRWVRLLPCRQVAQGCLCFATLMSESIPEGLCLEEPKPGYLARG